MEQKIGFKQCIIRQLCCCINELPEIKTCENKNHKRHFFNTHHVYLDDKAKPQPCLLPPSSPFSVLWPSFLIVYVTCTHDFSYLFELISLHSYNTALFPQKKEKKKERNTKLTYIRGKKIWGRKDVCKDLLRKNVFPIKTSIVGWRKSLIKGRGDVQRGKWKSGVMLMIKRKS